MTTSTVGLGWHPRLQGTWAAAGATVSTHGNLADAIAAAEANGHTIINEAAERSNAPRLAQVDGGCKKNGVSGKNFRWPGYPPRVPR